MSTGRLGAGDSAIQSTIVDAKGDLLTATAADTPARLAVGSANQTLLADSAQATGLKWGSSPQSLMTATGDLLYASSANTPARLGIGSTGQVLSVSGGVPTWASASSGISILGSKTITAGTNYTTTSTTQTAVNTTNFRVSITTGSSTTIIVILKGRAQIAGGGVNTWSVSLGAGTTYEMVACDSSYIGVNEACTVHIVTGLSANTAYNVDWTYRTSNAAQAAQIIGDSTNAYPRMVVLG
jgi:hypothetical protein